MKNTFTCELDNNGNKFWMLNRLWHRLDGPAVECVDGSKQWWVNGLLHRLDGPAVEYANGDKNWYVDGKYLTEQEFNKKVKMQPKFEIKNGTKLWKLNGKLHRIDGPAVEWANGSKYWWINGKRHRTDGPAVEYANGDKYWYVNGKLHRLDGPAVELADGSKAWWIDGKQLTEVKFNEVKNQPILTVDPKGTKRWKLNGKLHRLDGPAIECTNGDKWWWVDGKCHRTDGPAVEWANGNKAWHINDKYLTEQEFNEEIEKLKTQPICGTKRWKLNDNYHRLDGPAVEFADGTKWWYVDGKLHRTDGPAIEFANSDKEWWVNDKRLTETEFNEKVKNQPKLEVDSAGNKRWKLNGKLHRTDGPAIEWADGSKWWYVDGKLHRLDGPAIEWADGSKWWYVDGKRHRLDGPVIEYASGSKEWWIDSKRLTEQEFNEKVEKLKNQPTCETDKNGNKFWKLNGKLHRTDGPAVEFDNGTKYWYINGKLHRIDGPAIEYANGSKNWWINGKLLTETEFNEKVKNQRNPEIDSFGTKRWKSNGKLHRTDGPAIEYANGSKSWYINDKLHRLDGPAYEKVNGHKEWWIDGKQLTETDFNEKVKNIQNQPNLEVDVDGTKRWELNGKYHRTDGPAIEWANGSKFWYVDGKLHRLDGPAVEYANGNKEWYVDNQLHRTNGPAIEHANGSKWWYVNNKLHRLDGPAIEYASGSKEWWIDGKRLTEQEFNEKVKAIQNQSTLTIDKDGNKLWFLKSKLHRINGPACEWACGTKEWFLKDKYHRIDGPAVEYSDGHKAWYINGERHRTDGPAIEYANGNKEWYIDGKYLTETEFNEYSNGSKWWYIDGKQLTEQEFNEEIENMQNQPKMEIDSIGNKYWKLNGKLHRTDGPAVEWANGSKYWYVDGECHRIDGPAVEYTNGDKAWYVNNKLHRLDGPAIECTDGYKDWWINGKYLTETEFNEKVKKTTSTIDSFVEILNSQKEQIIKGLGIPAAIFGSNKSQKLKVGDFVEVNGIKEGTKSANGKFSFSAGMCCFSGNIFRVCKTNKDFVHLAKCTIGGLICNFDESWLTKQELMTAPFSVGDKVEFINQTFNENQPYTVIETYVVPEKLANADSAHFYVILDREAKIKEITANYLKLYENSLQLTCEIDNGTKVWKLNGKLHRLDGPAVEFDNGTKYWYVDGKLHRIDGPAIECHNGYKSWWVDGKYLTEQEFNEKIEKLKTQPTLTVDKDGSKYWYVNGKLHRLDGPAVEYANGNKEWYVDGEWHRTDGPAVEYANGDKFWYVNGKLHRLDGPAVESANGDKNWYVDGKYLTEQEFNKKIEKLKTQPTCETDSVGNKHWRVNGKLHRTDGPAVEFTDGTKSWHVNGKLHRTDGPAIEFADGSKSWYVDGRFLTEQEFNEKIEKLKTQPTCETDSVGTKRWKSNGKLHRADGPAIEYCNGSKSWWIDGKRHRIDGPALEFASGSKEWWINGKKFTESQFNSYKPNHITFQIPNILIVLIFNIIVLFLTIKIFDNDLLKGIGLAIVSILTAHSTLSLFGK